MVRWVYRYYRGEEVEEKKKCDVGPLLKEMLVKVEEEVGEVEEVVDVKKQLEYVLAKEEEIKEMKFEWAFCRYAWEGHIRG